MCVLHQVCNLVNARQVEMKNVFKQIQGNLLFWMAVGFILVLQVVFIEMAHIRSEERRVGKECRP